MALKQCHQSCLQYQGCNSYEYNEKTKLCDLSNATYLTNDLKTNTLYWDLYILNPGQQNVYSFYLLCLYLFTYMYIYVCVFVHASVRVYVHGCVCVRECVFVCIYVCLCIHTYMYMFMSLFSKIPNVKSFVEIDTVFWDDQFIYIFVLNKYTHYIFFFTCFIIAILLF